ncbi:MAG: winged helix-turn-helix domain-containing protein [Beijerinckiaceae bacterium]|nr:winged helix-turn-helix domain-containing protein [Beijerinckiaceae bacterium]
MGMPDLQTSELMSCGLDWTDAVAPASKAIAFRRFRIVPTTRQLLRDGVEVEIGSRAFDLLLALLEARGRIVEKACIMKRVWPSTTVDESNLRFQMTALRRALGEDRDAIKTIPGRGYMLTEDIADRSSALTNASVVLADLPLLQQDPASERITILEYENALLRQAISNLKNRLPRFERQQKFTANSRQKPAFPLPLKASVR